ncbi:MAG: DUF362 domain-containing protein, partial [Deltaproteobacteria bacterium]|nr:DUF362 domain-containing protein [Deltaproteobacteria bacterium]
MSKPIVALVRYEEPRASVRLAVDLCRGLDGLEPGARVFVKPNVVFWTRAAAFPKWGVITTSRLVEEAVVLLKERGAGQIIIGEGLVTFKPNDMKTPAQAFESLGYNKLQKRFGVKVFNLSQRPFERIDLGQGLALNFNTDILHSDFVVNLPVLKTHVQTKVSLGLKNFKGVIDLASRRICHRAGPGQDLHHLVARLAEHLPPGLTIIDGIYSLERGPSFEGRARRSDLLVASPDVFSADKVGAAVLGHDPAGVAHLTQAAQRQGRSLDLTDLEVRGLAVEAVARPHEHSFPYNREGTLPLVLERMGVKGLTFPRYAAPLCTHCTLLYGVILRAVARAWSGRPWDDV